MPWAADSSSTMQSPDIIQVPITPSAGNAHVKSPSQGRATSPRPTARSSSLSGPLPCRSHCQATPTTTTEITWGTNSSERHSPVIRSRCREITAVRRSPKQIGRTV